MSHVFRYATVLTEAIEHTRDRNYLAEDFEEGATPIPSEEETPPIPVEDVPSTSDVIVRRGRRMRLPNTVEKKINSALEERGSSCSVYQLVEDILMETLEQIPDDAAWKPPNEMIGYQSASKGYIVESLPDIVKEPFGFRTTTQYLVSSRRVPGRCESEMLCFDVIASLLSNATSARMMHFRQYDNVAECVLVCSEVCNY